MHNLLLTFLINCVDCRKVVDVCQQNRGFHNWINIKLIYSSIRFFKTQTLEYNTKYERVKTNDMWTDNELRPNIFDQKIKSFKNNEKWSNKRF